MTFMARVTLTARLPYWNGVLLHFVRAVSLLLAQWGLAFVRHGSISADDDAIVGMMMTTRRCRRLPHATSGSARNTAASFSISEIQLGVRYIISAKCFA